MSRVKSTWLGDFWAAGPTIPTAHTKKTVSGRDTSEKIVRLMASPVFIPSKNEILTQNRNKGATISWRLFPSLHLSGECGVPRPAFTTRTRRRKESQRILLCPAATNEGRRFSQAPFGPPERAFHRRQLPLPAPCGPPQDPTS